MNDRATSGSVGKHERPGWDAGPPEDGGPLLNAIIREHGLFPYLDDPASLGLADRLAYEIHRPPGIGDVVFHAKQAEVYRLLADGRNVVLSAPTSFGKSLIIDAILAAGRYRTVVLVMPTVALIDETRRRLTRRLRGRYKIVTQPSQPPGERTVYVLTQERFWASPRSGSPRPASSPSTSSTNSTPGRTTSAQAC